MEKRKSKIQTIKELTKEGKGNLKMIEYLLWYIQSLEDQLKLEQSVSREIRYQRAVENNNALQIQYIRNQFDCGEISLSEYETEAKLRRSDSNKS